MTDEDARPGGNLAEEPDGTTAYAASLRPPGESLPDTPDDDESESDDDAFGVVPVDDQGRYDPEAVSGESDEYRPE